MTNLGKNIKYFRKLNKLSQAELANLLNVKPTAISAWEVGRNNPLMDKIEQMSKLFGVNKSKLLGESNNLKLSNQSTLEQIIAISSLLTDDRQLLILEEVRKQLNNQKQVSPYFIETH